MEPTTEITTAITRLESIVITVHTPEEYRGVAAFLQEVKARKQTVVEFFRDSKQKAHATWKAICNQENGFLEKLDEVEKKAKRAMRAYEIEEEAKRRAEEERLRREEAERVRKEQERLRLAAEKAREEGNKKVAQNLTQQAEAVQEVPISVPQTAVPKVEGMSHRKIWRARVLSKAHLIDAAAKDPRLAVFLDIAKPILEMAAAEKDGKLTVPGVEFYEEIVPVISQKGARLN